jgi:hypothetical protein
METFEMRLSIRYKYFNLKLNHVLVSVSKGGRYVVRSIAALLAAIALALLIDEFVRIEGWLNTSPWSVTIDYTSLFRKERIASVLITYLITVWPLKPKRYLISAVALIWIAVEYAVWFNHSLRIKENMSILGIDRLSERIAAGFYGGSWWDVIVLGLTLALLLWCLKTLISVFISPPFDSLDPSSTQTA